MNTLRPFRHRFLLTVLASLFLAAVAPSGRAAVIVYVGGGNDLWDGMTFTSDFEINRIIISDGAGLYRTVQENQVDFWPNNADPSGSGIPTNELLFVYGAETGTDNWANFLSTDGYFGWAQFDLNPGSQVITLLAYAYDDTHAELSLPTAVAAVAAAPEPGAGALCLAGLLGAAGWRRMRRLA